MPKLALAINSHESSEDVWQPFFGELEKFKWDKLFDKIYLFTSRKPVQEKIPDSLQSKVEVLLYDKNLPYNLQYLFCIKRVAEEYVVIANEDCIPSGFAKANQVKNILELMHTNQLEVDFVKCVRGCEIIDKTQFENIFLINKNSDMIFTQQVSIWNRKSLLNVYAHSPTSYIARKGGVQQEQLGTNVCKELGMRGALYYEGEKKVGMYHYDSKIFPHICTAIVGGRWNLVEYSLEVLQLSHTYDIDLTSRGIYASF